MHPAVSLWRAIVGNPAFRDIPYKVETTRGGQILMSPASNWHGSARAQVGFALRKGRKGGEIITECSVLTADGVKVADVAWASDAFMDRHGYRTPYQAAPEICVEVVSPGNSPDEIHHKITLYIAKGAQEVWVVADDGSVTYHDRDGQRPRSALVRTVQITKRR